jgi:hypothetical protein
MLLGLQDVQWAVRNSRGARKLARTPHVNKKKKKKNMEKQLRQKLGASEVETILLSTAGDMFGIGSND